MDTVYYNPYEVLVSGNSTWFKCNFHVHDVNPVRTGGFICIMKDYEEAGYDISVNADQQRFIDTSNLKNNTIRSFNGQEYAQYDGILLVGTNSFLSGTPQEVVDTCREQGGFSVACHPGIDPKNITDGAIPLRPEQIKQLKGLSGIEILNGCISRHITNGKSLGNSLAVTVWDELLSDGMLLWGFGSDDFHSFYEMDNAWTEVYASSVDFPDIRSAITRGSLCTSTGLRLEQFAVEKNRLIVKVDNPFYPAGEIEYRFFGTGGKELGRQTGRGNLALTINEAYIRIEAKARDGSGLWTQPLINRAFFDFTDEKNKAFKELNRRTS
jgi:hypothetical protein